MTLKSAILLAGCLSSSGVAANAVNANAHAGASPAAAAGAEEIMRPKQSRYLRNRKRHDVRRGAALNRKLERQGRRKEDIDLTAEDVGFWTRHLQGSIPDLTPKPTPNPTDPPATPNPTDPSATPNPTDPPATPNPTDPPATPNPTDPTSTPNPTEPPVNPTEPPITPFPTGPAATPPPTPAPFQPTPSPTTPSPTVTPTDSPTFPCNLTPDERAVQIRELMSSVSDPALFDDPSTPQAQALDWITNEDAIEPILCPNQIGDGCSRGGDVNPLVQRYSLAVFYYASLGDEWTQCSAPSDFSDPASVAAADAACNRVVTPFGVSNQRVGATSTQAWLGPDNECQWGGIACWGDDTPNLALCIDQLDFENDGLAGTLANEVSELTSLRFLILEQGTISGPIPSDYGDLERLLILDMDFNELTGDIPDEIYSLTNLQQLDLNDNQIGGSISSKIGDLSFLTFFQIDHNQLSDTIPTEMGELTNLRIAFLSDNDITGEMPQEVCALRNTTNPNGVLGVLVTDCGGPNPQVSCSCCSSCSEG